MSDLECAYSEMFEGTNNLQVNVLADVLGITVTQVIEALSIEIREWEERVGNFAQLSGDVFASHN